MRDRQPGAPILIASGYAKAEWIARRCQTNVAGAHGYWCRLG
jgi:hypothetical protein